MRLAVAAIAAFIALSAPAYGASECQWFGGWRCYVPGAPVSDQWTLPLAVYADSEYITPEALNEANSQMPTRGKRYRIIAATALRQQVPVEVLSGVYALFSGLGNFSDDRFGLDENAEPPRSTGSFRTDARLAAKELHRLHRMLYPNS